MSRSLIADLNLLQDREPLVFNLKGPENDPSSLYQGDSLPITTIKTVPYEDVTTRTENTVVMECYFTDRNANLVDIDWTNELKLIQFPDENETNSQIYEIGESPIQSSTPYSPRTQFLLTTSGPTQGATCLTVTDSNPRGSDITLLSPITRRLVISNLNKLLLWRARKARYRQR
ncbi:hypothetical protein ACTXT7_007111 [Hymenolepis weldensis]